MLLQRSQLTKRLFTQGLDLVLLRKCSVFADIFIPLKAENSRASDIFTNLCRCLCVYNILSVSAQRITVDTNSASYVLKTVFTFNDEIEVG